MLAHRSPLKRGVIRHARLIGVNDARITFVIQANSQTRRAGDRGLYENAKALDVDRVVPS